MWLNLVRTVDKWTNEVGQLSHHHHHTGHHFADAMTKKRSSVFFTEKIVVTPSVAAPGDNNPSDATAHGIDKSAASK